MNHDHLFEDLLEVLRICDECCGGTAAKRAREMRPRLQAFMDDVPEGLETALEGEYSMQNLSIIRSAAALLASGMKGRE